MQDRKEEATELIEILDQARGLVLDFEVGLHKGSRLLDEYEGMRIECDRLLREASLRVAVLAGT
jgi:hypothetical protein